VIFFGALHQGYAHAFELSLAALAVLLLAVAGLSRLLPAPAVPTAPSAAPVPSSADTAQSLAVEA
jgi:hypothetical protein